jgi:hypothetical protein
MTTPTIRDYCAAQVNDVTYLLECIRDGSFDPITLQGIADRANTALATPPAPSKEGEGPSDADLYDLAEIFNGDPVPAMRQALEKWGRPAAPSAPEVGEVGLLVDRLNQVAGDFDFLCNKIVNGECRTLACLQRGGYDDKLCRAGGIKPPDPLVATCPALEKAGAMRRAATLLQQQAAPAPAVAPVAVSERLPGEGDCDTEGRCWLLHVDNLGLLEWHFLDRYPSLDSYSYYGYTHWLPAHAIPLPQVGEVEW